MGISLNLHFVVLVGVMAEIPEMTFEVRADKGCERGNSGNGFGENSGFGVKEVNLRAEIDTSPPFGSVKEAVTRFEGTGTWSHFYKLGEAFVSSLASKFTLFF